ncbi:MAG: SAM-dependent methyltransferase [Acetobacteraceae bacterium]|nr:SAM-dependent methyltransferase [Acetobacteraceae bacterium]
MTNAGMPPEATGQLPRRSEGVMEGGGFYNEHSLPQHDAGSFGLAMLAQAAQAAPMPEPGGDFVIVDYGAAQGRNSLEPMRLAVQAVRARSPESMPIVVVHTDLPDNDFSILFKLVETSAASYLRSAPNVFSYAAGGSFYRQLFPSERISLGWSAIAVHWLSTAPTVIPGHIWASRATGHVLEAFAQQAKRDWLDFLRHRAAEMRPGARLVVVGGGADDQGDSGADGLMDLANEALRDLVGEGAMSAEEYGRMVIPVYCRTPGEYLAPFGSGGDAGGLVLEHQELKVLPDAYWQEYQRSSDVEAFAAAYADFFRAAYGPSLFGVLEPTRGPQERQALAARFQDLLQRRIAGDPRRAVCHWRVLVMCIAKPASPRP